MSTTAIIQRLVCAAFIMVTAPLPRAFADDVEDYLQGRWFEVEIVLFERLRVLDANNSEQLTHNQPRAWPPGLLELISPHDSGRSADAFPDAGSEICLGYPLLPMREPPQLRDPVDGLELSANVPSAEDRTETLYPRDDELSAQTSDAPTQSAQTQPGPVVPPTAVDQVLQRIARYEQELGARAFKPTDQLLLEDQVKTLNRQAHLRPLLHQRWLMPVPPREAPAAVYIATEITPRAPATRAGLPKVMGYVEVSVGRYLHLAPTLWYHADNIGLAPMTLPVLPAQFRAGDAYRELQLLDQSYMLMQQSRRMRSGELHYIDHPKIGMLVRIDPVEVPEELEQALDSALTADAG